MTTVRLHPVLAELLDGCIAAGWPCLCGRRVPVSEVRCSCGVSRAELERMAVEATRAAS